MSQVFDFFSFLCPRATSLANFKLIVYKQGARGTCESLGACRGEHEYCLPPDRLCCPLVVAAFHPYAAELSISLLWNEFPMVKPPSLPLPFLEYMDKACILMVY